MLGVAVLSIAGGWLIAGPANAHPGRARPEAVTVRPGAGYPATTFRVIFTAPDGSGTVHGLYRYYAITATGPDGGGGCLSQTGRNTGAPRAHARVQVKLRPGAQGWCVGTFHGRVSELERPVCRDGQACPQFIVLVRTIGEFSFTVAQAPPGGDTTPPVFAGLESAVTCTPVERPGETTPYHLSWKAARDNVTPTGKIVYEVFMSTTSGGEDFSHPSWTTSPGVTHFTTPPLPTAGSVYFVVRARDQAGNQDDNTVERAGVSPCV
jgi:hypothetical protein